MSSYEEGREARRNGVAKDACPYQPPNPMARLWTEGWSDSDAILKAMEPYQTHR